jgi:hypothetical protein
VTDKLATVDPIKEGAAWSARGAAGDCLQRVGDSCPLICLWIDEKGDIRYSKANITIHHAALMYSWFTNWLVRWWGKVDP